MSNDKLTTTSDPPILNKFFNKMHCRLVHSTVPFLTGKKIWDNKNNEWIRECIWICKEGCSPTKVEIFQRCVKND